jgi:hypothetical protein
MNWQYQIITARKRGHVLSAMAESNGKAPGPFRGRIAECQHE